MTKMKNFVCKTGKKQKDIHNVKSKAQKVIIIIVFILFTLYAISLVLPFVWVLFSSLKTENEFTNNSLSMPLDWLFNNYISAFSQLKVGKSNLIDMFLNSVLLTTIVSIPAVFFPCITAYAVSKYPSKFTKSLYFIALFIQIIPIVGSFPAFYRLVVNFGIKNNFAMIWILYTSGFGLNFFLFHAFFSSLSWSYAEAAFVDGASNYKVLFSIMLPQAIPMLVAIFITASIGNWNDYMLSFLYMDKYPTVSLGLYQYKLLQTYRANTPILFCGIILSILPVLIIFGLFSKTIMKNTSAGGLKG